MKTKQGFTLVELAITVAVGIVLLAVGIPVFSTLIANNRAAADSNALVTAFQLARSEAVKRGVPVAVCAGDGDKDNPTPAACSGTSDWTKGLLVRVPSSAETLRVWEVFKGDDESVGVTPFPAELNEVSFVADGSVGTGVCLKLTRKAGVGAVVRETHRWLAVDNTGRTRVVNKSKCDSVADPFGPCPAASCADE